ncbi:hypothetical protein BGZ76_004398, partial [Entomortierella beljakovae]
TRTISSQIIASQLFAEIAKEVWENKDAASISRTFITNIMASQDNKETQIGIQLSDILKHFEEKDTLPIYGNLKLNDCLEKVAVLLSGAITVRNQR